MTRAELTAYNYGRRLALSAQEAVKAGQGAVVPAACLLTPLEQDSLSRLGQDAWWALVQRGGNEVLGSPDAVPPLQT